MNTTPVLNLNNNNNNNNNNNKEAKSGDAIYGNFPSKDAPRNTDKNIPFTAAIFCFYF
jgi:hypothetical protein